MKSTSHNQCLPVQFPEPGEVVLPLGLQIEPGGLEGVSLLLHRVSDHLPETLGHSEAQVPRRDLAGVDDPTFEDLAVCEELLLIVLE